MRIAYADPPYLGCANKYPEKKEVDHVELIAQLQTYDAWALSCHSPSLKVLLPMCPDNVRVAAWVKPFCTFKVNVNPAYAWEPVLFVPLKRDRYVDTVRDWVISNITLKKGVVGAKPTDFCFWLFELLGAGEQDELDDLFPGTGIVSKCWQSYIEMKSCKQGELML
jgi:hypothetical protein